MDGTQIVQFEDAHALIADAADVGSTVHGLHDAWNGVHVTYHLAQTVANSVDAPFVRTTYPAAWVSRYLLNGYVAVDPVAGSGFDRSLPFEWCELEVGKEALAMMADAAAHDIGQHGYSVPVLDRHGRRALFSLNAPASMPFDRWEAFMDARRTEFAEIAHAVHRKALLELYGEDELPPLTAREREVLMWTAEGKDYKAVAAILSISEHTARGYLKTIRFKLNCGTITQAVAKAVRLRIITG